MKWQEIYDSLLQAREKISVRPDKGHDNYLA